MVRTTAASNAVLKPAMLKPGTIRPMIKSNIALMTKVNRPKVMMLIGRVSKMRIGFKINVSMPQTTAITIRVDQPPMVIPGIK